MYGESVFCSGCQLPIPPALVEREAGRCGTCGESVWIKTFPALSISRAPALAQSLEDHTEASCFYHAQNRATVPCEACGRFLCGLCALELPGGTLCPSCLKSGVSGKRVETLESSRTMHDSVALALATFPAVLVWPAMLAAPMAIFWAIRHWKSPRSIIPRSRVRLYLAIVFALLELGFVAFIIFGIVLALRTAP